jgi:serine/threonine-protein kinase PpkA
MSVQHHHDSAQPPLPEISGYRIARVLGAGGMSTIYLGEQISLSRKVAIKVMLPEALADEVSRRRFENEARTIARLEHPHIVGIHDVGRTEEGLPYYAMPYLPRGHLGQRELAGNQDRIRAILQALLSALAYAHARGVIHRDVKAENVLFDEAERPLLADFGIALRRGYGTRVTTAGLAVGSTAYMAPEQARGEEVDFRADLYSVGVLTWEMLTGELPYNAGDALSMAVMHAQDPVPRLPPGLRHWQSFIDRSLAKSPAKRFRDAQQMLAALERIPYRSGTTGQRAATGVRSGIATLRGLPAAAWIGAALVVAAGIGIASRHDDVERGRQFFRPQAGADATRELPAPGAAPHLPVIARPDDAMLRAAPESAAERWISDAERQIRTRKLTAPQGDNAYDSLLAAWQADPAHLRLLPTIDRLIEMLGDEAARHIGNGQDARALESIARASRLSERTQRSDGAAMKALRADVFKALTARIDRAAQAFDRDAAQRAAESAKGFGLDAAAMRTLSARAGRILQPGQRIMEGALEMVLLRDGDGLLAASPRAVSRGEYAAFASATGRAESLCRERASLLRIVAPRNWQEPGFEQSVGDPVVCVSWQDAAAYAEWQSQRSGRRYRLPDAAEARLLPASGGGKPVAEWSNDCSGSCGKRVAGGRGWRGNGGGRALDADRGYDDVGFRLVRDLDVADAKGKRISAVR